MKVIDLNFGEMQNVIASFLVEADEPILIETGPDSTFNNLSKNLKESGYDILDIKHVLVTHIHLDHAGAAWRFAEHAKIYVHPLGLKHLIDPTKLIESASMIYKEKMNPLWGQVKPIKPESIVPLKEQELNIGNKKINIIFTPGHAKHHACFLIDGYLFSGDEGGIRILDGPVLPPMPPPDINLEQWQESIKKLLALNANYICPTHFGCFENVKEHLQILSNNINKYSEFIKNHHKDSREQLLKNFLHFVGGFFKDTNIRNFYKIANPDEMNVWGLLRCYQNHP